MKRKITIKAIDPNHDWIVPNSLVFNIEMDNQTSKAFNTITSTNKSSTHSGGKR